MILNSSIFSIRNAWRTDHSVKRSSPDRRWDGRAIPRQSPLSRLLMNSLFVGLRSTILPKGNLSHFFTKTWFDFFFGGKFLFFLNILSSVNGSLVFHFRHFDLCLSFAIIVIFCPIFKCSKCNFLSKYRFIYFFQCQNFFFILSLPLSPSVSFPLFIFYFLLFSSFQQILCLTFFPF